MKVLSQRDPAWSQTKIGNTNITIGRYGCTLTSISMLSDYFGCYKSPKDMASFLKYDASGRILWQSAKFDKFRFLKRTYSKNDVEIRDAIKSPKKAVILELGYSHWVVACKDLGVLGYWVADPYDGKKRLNTKKITGAAFFIAN